MNWLFTRAWYGYKLMFSAYFVGAWVLGIAFSVITINIEAWHFAEASLKSVLFMFTVVMPLFTIVLVANAFAEDFEEVALPLIWSYPVNKPLLALERLVLVILLIVIYIGTTLWAIDHWLLALNWETIWNLITIFAPVHLFLASITLVFSLIGRNMLFGLAAGALYWLAEMVTLGQWTKGLFLFQAVWPLEGYDPLVQNRWVLGAAFPCFALSLALIIYGRHWIAKAR